MPDFVNPYANKTLAVLAYDCFTRARDLKQSGPFTAAERRDLVRDTYYLLCAIGNRLEWGQRLPGGKRGPPRTPGDRDATFEDCFMEWFEAEKAVMRQTTADRALWIAHEGRKPGWDGIEVKRRVEGSDEDLRAFLQHLDVLHGRHRIPKPMM